MAFNSYGFVLVFLPVTVLAYWIWARLCPGRGRLILLIAASLFFYALAARGALVLLLASITLNFLGSRLILASSGKARHAWLSAGVSANILLLLYFKYSGFLLANMGLVSMASPLRDIILPLGISFFTFQQIAFLVDTARARIGPAHPLTYGASILFFPTILAGPITYYREFAPQAEADPDRGLIGTHVGVGAILLALGLFKKVVIGDSLALWVDPLFAAAGAGQEMGMLLAWSMAVGYLLQLYFDFSGYSDMALGCARMVGIRLPLNFFSPMRVTSIIDWWRRWHMSLGRFVGDYIFQPLALPLTRWAMRRRLGRWPVHILSVLVPTFIAMFIVGAWHGGNWTFMVFGLLHAFFMVVAEGWRFLRRKSRRKTVSRGAKIAGNCATLSAVLITMIPFRAPDMATTMHLWEAMIGLGNAGAPVVWGALPGLGATGYGLMMLLAAAIVFLLPNSAQFLGKFDPALAWAAWRGQARPCLNLSFAPRLAWTIPLGVLFFLGLAFISRGSGGFVYAGY